METKKSKVSWKKVILSTIVIVLISILIAGEIFLFKKLISEKLTPINYNKFKEISETNKINKIDIITTKNYYKYLVISDDTNRYLLNYSNLKTQETIDTLESLLDNDPSIVLEEDSDGIFNENYTESSVKPLAYYNTIIFMIVFSIIGYFYC